MRRGMPRWRGVTQSKTDLFKDLTRRSRACASVWGASPGSSQGALNSAAPSQTQATSVLPGPCLGCTVPAITPSNAGRCLLEQTMWASSSERELPLALLVND